MECSATTVPARSGGVLGTVATAVPTVAPAGSDSPTNAAANAVNRANTPRMSVPLRRPRNTGASMRPWGRRGTHTEEPHISRTADTQDRPTPWVDMAPGLRRLISERATVATTAAPPFVADARSPRTVGHSAPPAEAARARSLIAPALVLTDRPGPAADRGATERVLVTPEGLPASPIGTATTATAGPGSVLLLTSGSTGTPKAVALTEAQCLHVA